jgi:protein TonB
MPRITTIIITILLAALAACHTNDYKLEEKAPGADSGARRIVTAKGPNDSIAAGMLPPKARFSDTITSNTSPRTTAIAKRPRAATPPLTKDKFARGRASIAAPRVYGKAEVPPQFPGGEHALDNYINKNMNIPSQAIDDGVSGIVHVSFVVDEKGHVTKVKIMDSGRIGDGVDQEALRVVRNMPAWTPGKVRGRNVSTRMELPISFQVEG